MNPRTLIIKRFVQFALIVGLIASLTAAWIGYGNPWREVTFYKYKAGEDISHLFYVERCNADETCDIHPEHRQLLHFKLGGNRSGGKIQGDGNNPISKIRELGLTALPSPNEIEAALKWCTDSHILQEFQHHSRLYIVPLPDDPNATVACVKGQVSGGFSACIAGPMELNEDCERFSSLE